MSVKAKPFWCSQKALAASTALPLHADLIVAMAKGRQTYRLDSGGAQAQRHEHRQLEEAGLASLKTRFIYPLETARNHLTLVECQQVKPDPILPKYFHVQKLSTPETLPFRILHQDFNFIRPRSINLRQ
jgi:hypothetical protein